MLAIFAAVIFVSMIANYLLSGPLLLSHFEQLETEQTKQNVEAAVTMLNDAYHSLGTTAADYAYWDRVYDFMAHPAKSDISPEFQNGGMEGLSINLIVIRDMSGKIVFAKAYDTQAHAEVAVPFRFLDTLFEKPEMQPASVATMPRDGLVEFPDGPYLISTRPILTSERGGDSRGVFLVGRRFDEEGRAQLSDLTHTSLTFVQLGHGPLPKDFAVAFQSLQRNSEEVEVRPMNRERIGGYTLVPDVFGTPLFILRVDTSRPIYAQGVASARYTFGSLLLRAVLSSLVILFFLQKYVVSRICDLAQNVKSIGERKAMSERVEAQGHDEIAVLANSINGMLEELEKSHAQFNFLTENIHQIFWVKTPYGPFQYVSPAFEKICGRSQQALLDKPDSWQELIHPDDRKIVERMSFQNSRGKLADFYFRIIAGDGSLHWLWQRSFPFRGRNNELHQIVGITEDITEFKRNEEALLQAHRELEQRVEQRTAELAERSELVKLLVDSTPGAIYGVDRQGYCTFVNPACLRLLNYSTAEELLGRKIHDVIHHTRADGTPYPAAACPVFASFSDGQDAHVVDEIFWRKDGSGFPVEYGSRRIRRHGEIVGAVVSFVDITDRKRRELELRHSQKLEAVGRLAAGIAHEINTPIQFVADNTRFLMQAFMAGAKLAQKYEELHGAAERGVVTLELLNDVARARQDSDWNYLEREIPLAIEQMLEGLARVSTIVRGMKEFSHVDRASEKAPGDLNRALESALVVARNELKYVADVETDFGQLPPLVCYLGDLNQVFLNLLVNAAHAVEDATKGTGHKGKITVRTRTDGDWAEVSIADTGTGIPRDIREKIFDPFFTTKEVGKRYGTGFGIGTGHCRGKARWQHYVRNENRKRHNFFCAASPEWKRGA